jgi:hypothetical protein
MKEHSVAQGECLNSIAYENGFFWRTLWDAPENAGLKEQRTDPAILFPGDTVEIPDPRPNSVSRSVGQRHRFRLKGVPARVRIQVLWADEPRRNQPYELEIDGNVTTGETDREGFLERNIPPNARSGVLTVGKGLRKRTYRLALGALDPVSEIAGAQKRLNNLGFWCGPEHGNLNEETRSAVCAFQRQQKMEITGELDQTTLDKLRGIHEAR